ncbi:DUF2911 domain-containing protein [soil metagenome]
MKRSLSVLLLALVATVAAMAQKPSPAAKAEGTIDGVKVTIEYSQPSAKGRKVMGGLVPFGEVWRTGANETTTIEFSAPVKIEGKDVPAGKYGLFTVPGESEWVLIINKGIKWGAYTYKKEEDVIRVSGKPSKTATLVEVFNIAVEKDQITIKWENTQVSFKVKK